ncbi:MAG: 2-amino-4-hydroxy-6-hydroxymethyldihydropteridine diphosphokinase [Gammaproteobacteria bacterium]|nr:2-amino-4-hydroxy-6-hydroxymethyldihydropteridine diphosphokinase [Gammaproteobacteria bacterium]
MPQVFVSIGSNIQAAQNIRSSLQTLKQQFGSLIQSQTYQSPAVGFEGAPFYNLVVGFSSALPLWDLYDQLRQIETDHGRQRNGIKFSSRPLDLDILLYGELHLETEKLQLPSAEIEQYAFVLKPLADCVPDQIHPVLRQSYQQLWNGFQGDKTELQRITL